MAGPCENGQAVAEPKFFLKKAKLNLLLYFSIFNSLNINVYALFFEEKKNNKLKSIYTFKKRKKNAIT